MADKKYIDVENYCNNVCHCNKNYCNKEVCPIWTAPAADVAEVKHGKYLVDEDGTVYCSECKASALEWTERSRTFDKKRT